MKADVRLVSCAQRKEAAERLARRFNLPLGHQLSKTTYQLYLAADRLELHDSRPGAPGPLYAEFATGAARHRRLFGGGRKQPLARAIGVKAGFNPSVLDCTAGLGRDAFVLATLGCGVTMVERSPVLAALLDDALERAALTTETAGIVSRMHLAYGEALQYLNRLDDERRPDTIYLDPMYPHRTKSALVKKEMRITRDLVGDDADAADLLQRALDVTRRRVAVKRPAGAPSLDGPEPDTVIKSKKTRYDIYIKSGTRGKDKV